MVILFGDYFNFLFAENNMTYIIYLESAFTNLGSLLPKIFPANQIQALLNQ